MSVNKNQINNQLQNRGQFAQIPNEIWKVENLSQSARTVWMYLASEGPGWQSSCSNIGRNIDMALNTVRKAVEELEAKNMIVVTAHSAGTDFELVSSDQWNVQWKVAPAKNAQVPIKTCTGAYAKNAQGLMQNLPGIQYDTNTIQYYSKPSKAEAFENCKGGRDSSFKEKGTQVQLTPEWKDSSSQWYQHYLKSGVYETAFNSLPEDMRASLYNVKDKEEFLGLVMEADPTRLSALFNPSTIEVDLDSL